jgi:prepilin-type N-terminal cleavage/methylation domain-containing protein
MRARAGFTVIELLVVMMLAGIIAGTTIPRLSRAMAQNRVQRAAAVVSTDLQLAHSMAARQRRPVRLDVDAGAGVIRVRDAATPTTIYSERHLGTRGEYGLQSISTDRTQIIIYPTGLSSDPIRIELNAANTKRVIRMSKAGQIRVSTP